jgi:hypothetical protein
MSLIKTRRIIKPILKNGNTNELKLKCIIADSPFKAEYLIPTITKNEFDSEQDVEKYFKRKGVAILPWTADGVFKYKTGHLNLSFELSDCYYGFNMIIVVFEAFGKNYIFDIKDIDVKEMINIDGVDLNYLI